MKPRLVATSGPLAGSTFDIAGGRTSIGRDSGSEIFIEDALLSRRHCQLVCTEDGVTIEDAGSYNQTFVNGLPVKDRRLEHGDVVQAGASTFIFCIHDANDRLPPLVQLDDDDNELSRTTRLLSGRRMREGSYPPTRGLAQGTPAQSRVLRDLEILLNVSRSLSQSRTLDDLRSRLLDLVFDVLPAERGAILLDPFGPASAREFSSVFVRPRLSEGARFRISRTLMEYIVEKAEAVLCGEVSSHTEFSGVRSLRTDNVESLLGVPICDTRGVVGVIYLDSKKPHAFGEDALQLLAAIAGIVAAPLENLRRLEWWESERRREEREVIDYNMIGAGDPIRRVREAISMVAPTSATVLILGESGTGKELVARAIHNAGARAERRFVAVNCASLKPELVEAELFGSEPGGFTGAVKRQGMLEVADRGTLFLDEVGELDARAQAALLRVLETGEFRRVGGTAIIRVDARILAATNMDMDRAVKDGRFREDLFHRLNVFRIDVPPLRERRGDILLLAAYFTRKAALKYNKPIEGMTADARRCILHADWPGNIRQLQNAIERAVISAYGDVINVEDLPVELIRGDVERGITVPRLYEQINQATKGIILDAIRSVDGRVPEAAAILGIHPNNLHRLITRLEIRGEVESIRKNEARA